MIDLYYYSGPWWGARRVTMVHAWHGPLVVKASSLDQNPTIHQALRRIHPTLTEPHRKPIIPLYPEMFGSKQLPSSRLLLLTEKRIPWLNYTSRFLGFAVWTMVSPGVNSGKRLSLQVCQLPPRAKVARSKANRVDHWRRREEEDAIRVETEGRGVVFMITHLGSVDTITCKLMFMANQSLPYRSLITYSWSPGFFITDIYIY